MSSSFPVFRHSHKLGLSQNTIPPFGCITIEFISFRCFKRWNVIYRYFPRISSGTLSLLSTVGNSFHSPVYIRSLEMSNPPFRASFHINLTTSQQVTLFQVLCLLYCKSTSSCSVAYVCVQKSFSNNEIASLGVNLCEQRIPLVVLFTILIWMYGKFNKWTEILTAWVISVISQYLLCY